LLFQILLAALTLKFLLVGLSDSIWADYVLLVAVFTMVLAVAHGMNYLPGIAKAALGSIPYRIAFIFASAFIALVSTGFLAIFTLTATLLLPSGFIIGTWMARFSLTSGIDNLIGSVLAVAMFAGYAYVAGTLSILMLLGPDQRIVNHWILKGMDQSPAGFEFPDDAFPYTPAPMPAKPAARVPVRPVLPPPKPPDRAACGCPFREARGNDLEKTELLSRTAYAGPWSRDTFARFSQLRRCLGCSALWWMDVHESTYETIDDRSPEPEPPIITHRVVTQTGIRVRDPAHAEQLNAWAPEAWRAYERWDRARPKGLQSRESANAVELQAAAEALAAAIALHPEAKVILPAEGRTDP